MYDHNVSHFHVSIILDTGLNYLYLHGGSVALWDHLVLHLFNNFSRQFSYSELSSTFLVTQDTSVFTLISQGGTCKNQLPLLAFTDQFKAICLACDLLTILLKLKIEWILNWYVPHTEYMYFFSWIWSLSENIRISNLVPGNSGLLTADFDLQDGLFSFLYLNILDPLNKVINTYVVTYKENMW